MKRLCQPEFSSVPEASVACVYTVTLQRMAVGCSKCECVSMCLHYTDRIKTATSNH